MARTIKDRLEKPSLLRVPLEPLEESSLTQTQTGRDIEVEAGESPAISGEVQRLADVFGLQVVYFKGDDSFVKSVIGTT